MYQQLGLITTALLISVSALATTPTSLSPELRKDYDEFQKSYEDIVTMSEDKAKFLKEFKTIENKLQKKYKTFDKKEGQALSNEGNQMALDIEMLEPLKIIAEGNASKESCSNAEFINELNNQSDAKTYEKLKIQIAKLCK
ncbi:hypothetical protein CIK05_09275 [Bdellovibrio sp. qaytius]|nr:hypothetical protein CIK05_09275 [Bdellovibrio sp. qaytius]